MKKLAVLALLALPLAACGASDEATPKEKADDTIAAMSVATVAPMTTDAPVTTAAPTTAAPTTTAPAPTETPGQKNARKKAESYLGMMAFSQSGLARQLEFEGFSAEDAAYGVGAVAVDWNEQAAKKAQEYLDLMAFSRQGLIDQLVHEGFTAEQAEYGVSTTGL